jgi:hypothetical protein
MPQYLLLLYSEPYQLTDEESMAEMPKWMQYTEELKASGLHLGGEALEPIETATTVRVRNGETLLTDGPFAETKEVLGGFYMLDAPDLDTAVKWAAKIPNVDRGSVEVRPIWDTSQFATEAGDSSAAQA